MPDTGILAYRSQYFDGVKALWKEAFPGDPHGSEAEVAVPAKLAVQPELFLVAVDADLVIGPVMAGYDGHRGWLYALAVLNAHRRRGVGTALVREAEERLLAMGCNKINLQVRTANVAVVAFYRRLGYAIEERVSMGKRIGASPHGSG